jgi:hypothetical protein
VFERAVLRHRLRVQRHELREIASWADARTSDLGDRLVTLTADAEAEARFLTTARRGPRTYLLPVCPRPTLGVRFGACSGRIR